MKRSGLVACSLALAAMLVSSFVLPSPAFAANFLPTGIAFLTTQKMYTAGETVRVLAQIHSYSIGNQMLITVYAPDKTTVASNRISDVGPLVEFSFKLDKNESRLGQWRVVALYTDQRVETTFNLVDSNSFHKAIIDKPVLKDSLGLQMTSDKQKVGQPMAISADIENDLDGVTQKFVFIAQVLDKDNVPVHVSFVMASMESGQTVSPSVNWTPKAGGTYTVEVFVWDSLGVPVPLVDKQAEIFEIYA